MAGNQDFVINLKRLRERLSAVQEQTSRPVDTEVALVSEESRRDNSKTIILAYFVSILFAIALIFFMAFFSGEWEKSIGYFFDLIKFAVMPVITLVIGFYFGKSSK